MLVLTISNGHKSNRFFADVCMVFDSDTSLDSPLSMNSSINIIKRIIRNENDRFEQYEGKFSEENRTAYRQKLTSFAAYCSCLRLCTKNYQISYLLVRDLDSLPTLVSDVFPILSGPVLF